MKWLRKFFDRYRPISAAYAEDADYEALWQKHCASPEPKPETSIEALARMVS